MGVSLGQAAKLAGVGKTTITRAIQSGRLSATRRPDGGYEIDPAELARVYTITILPPETVTATGHPVHQATPEARSRDPERDPALVGLEMQIALLREMLADTREDRDRWRTMAETAHRAITDARTAEPIPRASLWRRLVG